MAGLPFPSIVVIDNIGNGRLFNKVGSRINPLLLPEVLLLFDIVFTGIITLKVIDLGFNG